MKLDEFEIGQLCAGMRREREALAEATGRIGAVEKQSADAAGCDHDAAGLDDQCAVLARREHARDRVVLDDEPARLRHLRAA